MHKYVRMTVLFPTPLLQKGIILVFPCSIERTKDEVDHPWSLSSHGDLLVLLSSNFEFLSTRRFPTHEQRGQLLHYI